MSTSIYPKHAEVVFYHNYCVEDIVDSKYIRGGKTTIEIGTSCPNCENINRVMTHGDYLKCPNCNLEMQVFGNSLHIWR